MKNRAVWEAYKISDQQGSKFIYTFFDEEVKKFLKCPQNSTEYVHE